MEDMPGSRDRDDGDGDGGLEVQGVSADSRSRSDLSLPKISSKWVLFDAMMLKRKHKW